NPISTETVEAIRIVPARSAATAMSLISTSGESNVSGRGHQPEPVAKPGGRFGASLIALLPGHYSRRGPLRRRFGPCAGALRAGERLGAVAEAFGLGRLLLEVLVDLEEVLDLLPVRRGHVVDVVHVCPDRIAERDADELLVRPLLVGHVEH